MIPKLAMLVVVVATLALLSCHLLLDLDYPQPTAATSAVDASDGAVIDPCSHATVPPLPAADDDPNTSMDYWFAVQEFEIPLAPDAGAKAGFDLDHACTCQSDLNDGAPSCETPHTEGMDCDYTGGIDDSVARVGSRLPLAKLDTSRTINQSIQTGIRTALLYLGDYNGRANDSDVQVAVVPATGLFSNLGCGELPRAGLPPGDGGAEHAPFWDGCDHWSPAKGRVILKSPHRVPTPTVPAYVSDHVVVAQIAEITLDVLGSPLSAHSGIATARLIPDAGSFRLEGIIAGRIPFAQLVEVIGRTESSQGDGGRIPLCKTPYWPTFAPLLCSARDVMESPSQDGTGQRCTAASTAIGFRALPALVDDEEYDREPRVVDCNVVVDCP